MIKKSDIPLFGLWFEQFEWYSKLGNFMSIVSLYGYFSIKDLSHDVTIVFTWKYIDRLLVLCIVHFHRMSGFKSNLIKETQSQNQYAFCCNDISKFESYDMNYWCSFGRTLNWFSLLWLFILYWLEIRVWHVFHLFLPLFWPRNKLKRDFIQF